MRGRMLRLTLIWVAVTVAVLAGWPGQASAFDVGYHSDLTFEVLSREGFAADATGAAVVANYLDDGFESAKTVIAEAGGILAPLGHAWGNLYGPASARDASDLYLHFDDLPGTAEVSAAWDRLVRNTRRAAQEAERRQDPAGLLSVLGASLHTVQDFYSHSNWSNLDWGGDATWFDVPAAEREAKAIRSVDHAATNKDHAGRAGFDTAYREAFYASYQWTRLIRSWVGAGFWTGAAGLADPSVSLELHYVRYLSWYTGHWKGPGTDSKDDLLAVGQAYLREANKNLIGKWKEYCPLLTASPDPGALPPLGLTYPVGRPWLSLRTLEAKQTDDDLIWDIDVGGKADFYAAIKVGGRTYVEQMYEDHDSVRPSNWLTLAPVDQWSCPGGTLAVEYVLWDEDVLGGGALPSLRGQDDLCDIAEPLQAKTWVWSGAPGTFGGGGQEITTDGLRRNVHCCESDGDGDEARVTFLIRTETPQRRPYSAAVQGETIAAEAPVAKSGDVRITSIDKVGEVVTVTNYDVRAVDMTGWRLVSVTGNQTFRFPSFTLRAGASVRVRSGPKATGNGQTELFWTKRYVWNNEVDDPGRLEDSETAKHAATDLSAEEKAWVETVRRGGGTGAGGAAGGVAGGWAAVKTFGDHRLVVVVVGPQRTGGYGLSLTRVYTSQGLWCIDVTLSKPKPGAITTQALTYPYVVVKIPDDGLGVRAREVGGQEPVELTGAGDRRGRGCRRSRPGPCR